MDKVSFFRIPAKFNNCAPVINELSMLRKKWILSSNSEIDEESIINARLCSRYILTDVGK